MIVDDNDLILESFLFFLKDLHYRLACFRSAPKALAALSPHKYPIIISDVDMPGMDGQTLLTEIKKRFRKKKVLMMSGLHRFPLRFQLLGALDLLEKPFDIIAVVDTFKKIQKEKRRTKRFSLELPIIINGEHDGLADNISTDGILFKSTAKFNLGTRPVITFKGPKDQVRLKIPGKVVRTGTRDSQRMTAVYFDRYIGLELLPLVQMMYKDVRI